MAWVRVASGNSRGDLMGEEGGDMRAMAEALSCFLRADWH